MRVCVCVCVCGLACCDVLGGGRGVLGGGLGDRRRGGGVGRAIRFSKILSDFCSRDLNIISFCISRELGEVSDKKK